MTELSEQQFRMAHRPPEADYGAPLHDLSNAYPDYDTRPNLYTHSTYVGSSAAMATAIRVKGKPDAQVPIYRAAPHGVDQINPGDWVTTSHAYAKMHASYGCPHCGKDMPVISGRAKASDLHSSGDLITEYGYNGASPIRKGGK